MEIKAPKTIKDALRLGAIMIIMAIAYGCVQIINDSVEEVVEEPTQEFNPKGKK